MYKRSTAYDSYFFLMLFLITHSYRASFYRNVINAQQQRSPTYRYLLPQKKPTKNTHGLDCQDFFVDPPPPSPLSKKMFRACGKELAIIFPSELKFRSGKSDKT